MRFIRKRTVTFIAIGLAIVTAILGGRLLLENEESYYVGPIISINDEHLELRVMIDNGEILNFHDARYESLRIDDYMMRYTHGFEGESPGVGMAYIFFYQEAKGGDTLSHLVPFRDPPIEARIVNLGNPNSEQIVRDNPIYASREKR